MKVPLTKDDLKEINELSKSDQHIWDIDFVDSISYAVFPKRLYEQAMEYGIIEDACGYDKTMEDSMKYKYLLVKLNDPLKSFSSYINEMLTEDQVLQLLRDAGLGGEKMMDMLTYTKWKDGLDIEEPIPELMKFVELVRKYV